MQQPQYLRVLYTKHLVKKKKTYHDGFIKLEEDRTAHLLDEDGHRLTSAKIPISALPLSSDTEGLDCFEGFLVNYDEACLVSDIPRQAATIQDAAKPSSKGGVPPQGALALEELHASKRPRVAQFKRPQPKPAVAHGPPAALGLSHPAQPCTSRRTDDELLCMFGGRAGVSDAPKSNPAKGEAAQPCRERIANDHTCDEAIDVKDAGVPHEQRHEQLDLANNACIDSEEAADQGCGPHSRWTCEEAASAASGPGADDNDSSPRGIATGPAVSRWAPPCSQDPAAAGQNSTQQAAPNRQWQAKPPLLSSSAWNASPGPGIGTLEGPVKRGQFQVPGFQDPSRAREMLGDHEQPGGGLRFPMPGEVLPQRCCEIRDSYETVNGYLDNLSCALEEEINLRVAEVGIQFHRISQQTAGDGRVGKPRDMVALMRQAGIQYYDNCQLLHFPKRPEWDKPEAFFLVLTGRREASKDYRQDDLWIISDQPHFSASTGSRGVGLKSGWTAFARSNWHGPNKEGKLRVIFLGRGLPCAPKSQQVFAIHACDVSMELAMQDSLKLQQEQTPPLLPSLLSSPQDPIQARPQEADTCRADHFARVFGLNEDQAAALKATSGWFGKGTYEEKIASLPPFCIIHGPFGSGKSTLLVALLMFFADRLSKASSQGTASANRILMAAHTNVAVDRVLNGLLDQGFTDFLRVGSLRRIDKRLLPHSLHARQNSGKSDAASELADMLKTCTDPQEAALLRRELEQLKAGAEKKRRQLLKKTRIVGVTCCSVSQPMLDSLAFDFCVLDECSQIVEPLSLMTLARAGCRFLVAAGDCCQLPPLIANPTAIETHGARQAFGLGRPLISRLMALGHPYHLLRSQYRCHPSLSAVPNELFYGGKLLNGCSAESRAPLVACLPELTFVHASGSCAADAGSQSCCNKEEARCIATIVKRLIAAGVVPESIGVICFFRAQVALVKGLLGSLTAAEGKQSPAATTVATVDSFQGLEKEIIILSITVTRLGPFASDSQRLNVALTRARRHLILVGDPGVTPRLAPAFARLVHWARGLPGGICSNVAGFVPQRRITDEGVTIEEELGED